MGRLPPPPSPVAAPAGVQSWDAPAMGLGRALIRRTRAGRCCRQHSRGLNAGWALHGRCIQVFRPRQANSLRTSPSGAGPPAAPPPAARGVGRPGTGPAPACSMCSSFLRLQGAHLLVRIRNHKRLGQLAKQEPQVPRGHLRHWQRAQVGCHCLWRVPAAAAEAQHKERAQRHRRPTQRQQFALLPRVTGPGGAACCTACGPAPRRPAGAAQTLAAKCRPPFQI